MGNKIITEKDFWRCTGGLMPVPFQNNGGKAKKVSSETYITKKDTATISTMDFSCTKLMFVMAILAAIIAVAILATGGAALVVLVAAGAAAGAAGAAAGAALGGLLCGQKVAVARIWESFKSNFKIQGQEAITGNDMMLCPIFGDKITFAPEIKNWWQALAEGGANLIAGVLEGMLAGAAIGLGGGAIGGTRAAFMQGGTRAIAQASLNVLKSAPINIFRNYIGTWTSSLGWGLRGTMATESALRSYGENENVALTDVGKGLIGMELGTAHSAQNIYGHATGAVDENGTPIQSTWHDYAGMALWMTPVHKINQKAKSNSEKAKTTEESTKTHKSKESKGSEKAKGEFEAFEAKTRVQKIAESKAAYEKASSSYDNLPTSKSKKTVASDGVKSVSGWSKNRVSNKFKSKEGVKDVSTKDVLDYGKELGHDFNKNSSLDHGIEGQSSASHAEKQLMTTKPKDAIGVSRPMCNNCKGMAQKHATKIGQDYIVTDPNGTYIFEAGGSEPIFIPN